MADYDALKDDEAFTQGHPVFKMAAHIDALEQEALRYRDALQKIVRVCAMDYEYQAWAKEALGGYTTATNKGVMYED